MEKQWKATELTITTFIPKKQSGHPWFLLQTLSSMITSEKPKIREFEIQ